MLRVTDAAHVLQTRLFLSRRLVTRCSTFNHPRGKRHVAHGARVGESSCHVAETNPSSSLLSVANNGIWKNIEKSARPMNRVRT